MSWVARYRAGDCEGVWRELVAAGPALRDDGGGWKEATEVAGELIGRAGRNVRRLHQALAQSGYSFDLGDAALTPPQPDIDERIAEVERTVGPMPLAVRVWLQEIGNVNLTGSHPLWGFQYGDPLVVECAIDDVVEEYEDRKHVGWFELAGTDRFPLSLAPDYLHKSDVSGGAPYGINLPAPAVDALWDNDALHQGLTFVEYLRSALLRWGGFPGWARHEPEFAAPAEPWPPLLEQLAETFERF
jgi:hypothetical protein